MTTPNNLKVVDSNVLQCSCLHEYLVKSAKNFAVLIDYAAVEAYKAKTLDMLYRSMRIAPALRNSRLNLQIKKRKFFWEVINLSLKQCKKQFREM